MIARTARCCWCRSLMCPPRGGAQAAASSPAPAARPSARRRSRSPVVQRCSVIAFGPRSDGLAAVDDHRVADGEGGLVGAQPEHGGGDLLRAAHASDWLLRDDRSAALVGVAGEA